MERGRRYVACFPVFLLCIGLECIVYRIIDWFIIWLYICCLYVTLPLSIYAAYMPIYISICPCAYLSIYASSIYICSLYVMLPI